MGKLKFMLLGFSIIGLLLSGCGTEANENTKEEKEEVNTEEKEKTSDNNQNEETTKDNNEQEANKDESTAVRLMEQNLQYQVNGGEQQETAFLVNSSNQNFSLYVLPDYELTAEEPGKDILKLKSATGVNARIELLPDNVNWAETEENTRNQLKAIGDDVKPVTESGLTIDNAIVQEVTVGDEKVTSVLIKNPKAPVRMTIFTTSSADHRKAFIEMGKTILKTK
ncbi:hypothetical protein [Bacillus sp. CECT 9360]|uniref:hypothetical protein n=1 Tax=Bacillus sp. CECT 9360 TaxID=2845821 RepID=UPI001E522BDE|nr:hypothetical protein [Bacillus sp. CECT 9360]CAH0345878.1 hypothetical protein BCI9360_02180 [Bacillus sp. CECT 9360]